MTTSYKHVEVYVELCKEFPKVDPRILKAVAFENQADYDAAFLVMVDEVLPYIPEVTNSSYIARMDLTDQSIASDEDGNLVSAGQEVAQDADADSALSDDCVLVLKNTCISDTLVPELYVENCLQEVSKINSTEKLISLCKDFANHLNVLPERTSHLTTLHEDLEAKFMSANLHGENGHSSFMAEKLVPLIETTGFPAFVVLPAIEEQDENLVFNKAIGSEEAVDSAFESQDGPGMAVSKVEQKDLIDVSDSELQQDRDNIYWFDVSMIPGNSIEFLHRQTEKIKLLGLSIEEAKAIKKSLYSALEAVRNALRKVEEREEAAEKAKEEASEGGLEILSRAEELKIVLQEAKEDNDMHAGEVYVERSILAAEAMELQSRLANLTEERDKALCILDEMHFSLESRLGAADEKVRKAQEEKLKKEVIAETYFYELEDAIATIVQEAKFLQLESGENSKLRELLEDRGHAVDTLQGEISVICQEVDSLKRRFDKSAPLSEAVSSSPTASILASPASSQRSSISTQVLSDQEAPSDPSIPAKQLTELDADDWELVEHL